MRRYLAFLMFFSLMICCIGCSNSTLENSLSSNTTETMPQVMLIGENNPNKIEVETELSTEIIEDTSEIAVVEEIQVITNNNIKNEISPKKELTLEEKNKILKEINEYTITNTEDLNNLVLLIDENIASFDLRERDLMVKKYIIESFNQMNNLNAILAVIGFDLETVVEKYDINVNDKVSINTIPDSYGSVKGFLLEVKDKGFFINSINENKEFYLDLDLNNVLEKYRDYISPSMIAYIEFNNYEMNNAMSFTETNSYDLDEIVTRINMLEDGMELDSKYNYVMIEKYTASLQYYYQLLLGLSHNHFVTTDNIFKTNIKNKYSVVITNNTDTTVATVLDKTLLVLETNDNIFDDNIKSMLNEYITSIIFTEDILNVLELQINNKYEVLTKSQINNLMKEKEESTTETTEEVEE